MSHQRWLMCSCGDAIHNPASAAEKLKGVVWFLKLQDLEDLHDLVPKQLIN